MVFATPIFLFLFLPVALALYFLCPRSFRNAMLVGVSLVFYAWGERAYTGVMLLSIAMNYGFGLWVHRAQQRGAGRGTLGFSIAANLVLLVAFKYANFLADAMSLLTVRVGLPAIHLAPVHLPIGISFFTFHAISYLVDVYREKAPAQRNPLNIALYITLFPQLVAGPIVRYLDIASEIGSRTVSMPDFAKGVRRFILGLAKKVLIANVLAVPADRIFSAPLSELPASVAWLGIVCYTLQIYFDFSGYSDMAIGLARMFGFHLLENFQYPYISSSIKEFWRRWHISLSSFFRDYLYVPLGGNRCSTWRVYLNLVIVFFLCGLWHGANWTFIAWGLFHGMLLVLERQRWMGWLDRVWVPFRHLYTLLAVMVGWVFFRADTMEKAVQYFSAMAGGGSSKGPLFVGLYLDPVVSTALVAGCLAATPILPWLRGVMVREQATWTESGVGYAVAIVRATALAALFVLCVSQLAAGTYNPFIYFRF